MGNKDGNNTEFYFHSPTWNIPVFPNELGIGKEHPGLGNVGPWMVVKHYSYGLWSALGGLHYRLGYTLGYCPFLIFISSFQPVYDHDRHGFSFSC